MMWILTRLLSTVLLLLALGSRATEQKEELQPTINTPGILSSIFDWLSNVIGSPYMIPTPAPDTKETATKCLLIYDSIGPFCQYVVPTEPDSGICQPGFSMETCNNCQDIVQLCGSPDDMDLENVCLSSLVSSCADPEPNPYSFITDYCSLIQSVCNGNGQSLFSAPNTANRHISEIISTPSTLSGSGSGSGSGGSGHGSDSNIGSGADVPTTGSQGLTKSATTTDTDVRGTSESIATTLPFTLNVSSEYLKQL